MPRLAVSAPIRKRAGELSLAVEDQLHSLGLWKDEPPGAVPSLHQRHARRSAQAFAQWLEFVLVPLLWRIASNEAELPEQTSLGARAAHELVGIRRADELESLLFEVDRLIRAYRNHEGWRAGPLHAPAPEPRRTRPSSPWQSV